MPTEFTHIFISSILGKTSFREKMPMRFWVLSGICAVLPDVDVIGYYFGIRYGDVFGHRGFFHSLLFALLIGVLIVVIAFPKIERLSKKWWGLAVFFFVVTASHGLLDAMTDKGLGVGFFIPFDNERYFMPWRPIFASPMRIQQFFSRTGLEVVMMEVLWIWVPLLVVFAGVSLYRKRHKGRPAA